MMKRADNRGSGNGFTLVEVTIFLAVAALLVVFVFVAYDKAQRSRRDSQREVDIGLVADSLEKFKNSSYGGGQYPTTATQFQIFFDPSNAPSAANANMGYALMNHADPLAHSNYTYSTSGSLVQPSGNIPASIVYVYGFACGVSSGTANPGTYSLTIGLENSNTGFCVDNH